jgi:hypothetical protein
MPDDDCLMSHAAVVAHETLSVFVLLSSHMVDPFLREEVRVFNVPLLQAIALSACAGLA